MNQWQHLLRWMAVGNWLLLFTLPALVGCKTGQPSNRTTRAASETRAEKPSAPGITITNVLVLPSAPAPSPVWFSNVTVVNLPNLTPSGEASNFISRSTRPVAGTAMDPGADYFQSIADLIETLRRVDLPADELRDLIKKVSITGLNALTNPALRQPANASPAEMEKFRGDIAQFREHQQQLGIQQQEYGFLVQSNLNQVRLDIDRLALNRERVDALVKRVFYCQIAAAGAILISIAAAFWTLTQLRYTVSVIRHERERVHQEREFLRRARASSD